VMQHWWLQTRIALKNKEWNWKYYELLAASSPWRNNKCLEAPEVVLRHQKPNCQPGNICDLVVLWRY
jgi:hypothetical protein